MVSPLVSTLCVSIIIITTSCTHGSSAISKLVSSLNVAGNFKAGWPRGYALDHIHVQSSLRTKDTLGTVLLFFARRLSLSRRFMIFQPIILNKLVNALKCIIIAVEMIIKWLVSSVFSINIAQAEFCLLLFLKYQNRYLDSRLILLSRMQHKIATA